MFTGIIKKVSQVEKVKKEKGNLFVWVKTPKGWTVSLGESISINGVCSTVKDKSKNNFLVEYMPETIKKTIAGNFKKGTIVNLEKSLKLNDLLDGHLVQGHIDGRGRIKEIKKVGQSEVMEISASQRIMPLIASKGSVGIDGISLTVVDVGKDWFSVSLVDYTLKNTNLGKLRKGEEVNIETDVLAKYINKLLKEKYAKKK